MILANFVFHYNLPFSSLVPINEIDGHNNMFYYETLLYTVSFTRSLVSFGFNKGYHSLILRERKFNRGL